MAKARPRLSPPTTERARIARADVRPGFHTHPHARATLTQSATAPTQATKLIASTVSTNSVTRLK